MKPLLLPSALNLAALIMAFVAGYVAVPAASAGLLILSGIVVTMAMVITGSEAHAEGMEDAWDAMEEQE